MRLTRLNPGYVDPPTGAFTLSKAVHDGKTIRFSSLTGHIITLPPALGTGAKFKFVVTVAPTSNAHIVKVANAVDVIQGAVTLTPVTVAGAVTADSAVAASPTHDTLTMNGTTGGGIRGSVFEVEDVGPGIWAARGQLVASGVVTTPWSATVA